MTAHHSNGRQVRRRVGVGAVITDEHRRLLLVLRRNEPQAGTWSIPGGKVEAGETLCAAVEREVLEETGLWVTCGDELWVVDLPDGVGGVYEVHDFAATTPLPAARPRAADDAADARWFTASELESLTLTDGLLTFLRRAGVLPADGVGPSGGVG